jgi:NAD(P)-dependent dehydrogenase (short-subunit alcohol dehydrogenase family)
MDATRVAIVTGAGSGVGRAVAEGLLDEGRTVVLVGRREAPLREVAEGHGPRAIVHPADIGDPEAGASVVSVAAAAAAAGKAGHLDAVVNNAGLAELAPFAETDDAMLDRSVTVNLLGPIRLLRAAWPHLAASTRGRIVNVSSMATADPFPGFLAYAATKTGLESVTRSAAGEGADAGIRAWTVAPGAIETPMLRGLFDESVLPREAAMDPATVAALILACLRDERPESSGATIRLAGPGAEPVAD